MESDGQPPEAVPLSDFNIVGPKTHSPVSVICDEPNFQQRKFDTSYVEAHPDIFNYPEPIHYVIEDTVTRPDR